MSAGWDYAAEYAATLVASLDAPKCHALFCALDAHDGDRHTDATGRGWAEPTPAQEVAARVYSWDEAS